MKKTLLSLIILSTTVSMGYASSCDDYLKHMTRSGIIIKVNSCIVR